jgi:hypothetical protein
VRGRGGALDGQDALHLELVLVLPVSSHAEALLRPPPLGGREHLGGHEGGDGAGTQRALQRELLEFALCLLEFFAGLRSHADALALTGALSAVFAEASLATRGVDTDAWFVWQGGEELRALLVRVTVIKRTDFMSGGHVLMQLLTIFIVAMFTLGSYVATINAYGGSLPLDSDAGATMYTSM